MSKIYSIKVEDNELNDIESKIRQHIIEFITREITRHSKELAISILQCKGLTRKKWYEYIENPNPLEKEIVK